MRDRFAVMTATVAAVLALAAAPAQAADPTTADCLGASDSSLKLGNQHRLRAARSQLLVCASPNCPGDIRKECLHRVDEVNAQIPTITFQAKDPTGADLSAVKVTMDGEPLAERLEGTALSIDPGEHTFLFETAGQTSVTKMFVIRQGEKDRRESVAFGTPPATPPPAATAPAAPLSSTGAATPPPDTGLGAEKIMALVAGGVGVVGLGIGTAFGVMAISKKNDAQSACPNVCTTAAGSSMWSDAGATGNISTIGFVVGAIGVAGAAVLWFTAPKSSSGASAQVGMGLGTLQLKGTW